MKLSTSIFACLLTVSAAGVAAAADKTSLPAQGASADVKVEPANAVISSGTAQVINQTGAVTRVNRGDGLVDLAVGTDLSVGDTVFAGPGSTVTSTPASRHARTRRYPGSLTRGIPASLTTRTRSPCWSRSTSLLARPPSTES